MENVNKRLINMKSRLRSYLSILSLKSRKWMRGQLEKTVGEKFPVLIKYMNPQILKALSQQQIQTQTKLQNRRFSSVPHLLLEMTFSFSGILCQTSKCPASPHHPSLLKGIMHTPSPKPAPSRCQEMMSGNDSEMIT